MTSLSYEFPLTKASGKIRIKERLTFGEYGIPVAPLQTVITKSHYIEWQIGYDTLSTNEQYHFIGYNGKKKIIYELSEFINFGYLQNLISKQDLLNLQNFIQNNNELIENTENITRTNFKKEKIANIDFLKSSVSYPLLVYKFSLNNMICEIIIKEKQYAVGIMPMLYFCLPISALNGDFLGRKIKSKEIAAFEINSKNIKIFIEMFKIFGVLSKTHKYDCVEILKYILKRK